MRNELESIQHINDIHEMARKKHKNLVFEEFYEPKDRVPSTTAESDYKHKKLLERYNKLHNP